MIEISVATDTGYKAEVRTVKVGENVEVHSAAYLFKGILSPFIVLKKFSSEHAERDADRYARRLVAALMDERETNNV